MTTSILIPTWNAEKEITGLLEALKSQTVSAEIIVVDSSSRDGTREIAKSFGIKTITVERGRFDHGGTRTMAGKAAEGELLVYLTQDATPVNDHAIENLIKPFDDAVVGAAYGRQLPSPGASVFSAHSRLFNYPEQPCLRRFADREIYGIKTPFLSNSFAAYRRTAWEEIGGFRENLISTEDTYAGAKLLKAGYALAYVPDALVLHSHNYSVFQEFRRYFDIGVFHEKERWIGETFGEAEGEGMKYMRSELNYLIENRKYHLIPEFIIRNGLKFAGYALGRRHSTIPKQLRHRLSMHREWWEEHSRFQ